MFLGFCEKIYEYWFLFLCGLITNFVLRLRWCIKDDTGKHWVWIIKNREIVFCALKEVLCDITFKSVNKIVLNGNPQLRYLYSNCCFRHHLFLLENSILWITGSFVISQIYYFCFLFLFLGQSQRRKFSNSWVCLALISSRNAMVTVILGW